MFLNRLLIVVSISVCSYGNERLFACSSHESKTKSSPFRMNSHPHRESEWGELFKGVESCEERFVHLICHLINKAHSLINAETGASQSESIHDLTLPQPFHRSVFSFQSTSHSPCQGYCEECGDTSEDKALEQRNTFLPWRFWTSNVNWLLDVAVYGWWSLTFVTPLQMSGISQC